MSFVEDSDSLSSEDEYLRSLARDQRRDDVVGFRLGDSVPSLIDHFMSLNSKS